MSKVLMLLVALAMFAAMPAMAIGHEENGHEENGDTSSHNEQEGEIDQDAEAGSGGNAGNQACLIQQNAGRGDDGEHNGEHNGGPVLVQENGDNGDGDSNGGDANAACNQEQGFTTQNNVNRGVGAGDVDRVGVGGADVTGVGGGGVQSVTLARTGFDAWVLALIGGLTLAGGIGLLAAQRRGRPSA